MSNLARRTFEPSGDKLSIIGFGGIIVMNAEKEESKNCVAEAIDLGVNYFDIAPAYGNAEERLGPALKPYVNDVFLACKTGHRDAKNAENDLTNSLKVLHRDYFNLYQLHAITDVEKDVKAVFAKDGAMSYLMKAKEKGLIKHLGFSAHSVEAVFAALEEYPFDSVLFPINYTTYSQCNFGPQVLEEASKRGMGRLALKAMARGKWQDGTEDKKKSHPKLWYEPVTEQRQIELALRYTLSQNVTAALPPGQMDLFRKAVSVAQEFKPVTEQEVQELDEILGNREPLFEKVES